MSTLYSASLTYIISLYPFSCVGLVYYYAPFTDKNTEPPKIQAKCPNLSYSAWLGTCNQLV